MSVSHSVHMASLGPLIFLTRNVAQTCGFFVEVLGLKTVHLTPHYAELNDHAKTTIILRKTDSEAFCATGFSPLVTFNVLDFKGTVEAIRKHGGRLDGDPLEDKELGWLASFRSPDGHMFAITEKKLPQEQPELDTPSSETHPAAEEIKRLLQNIKI